DALCCDSAGIVVSGVLTGLTASSIAGVALGAGAVRVVALAALPEAVAFAAGFFAVADDFLAALFGAAADLATAAFLALVALVAVFFAAMFRLPSFPKAFEKDAGLYRPSRGCTGVLRGRPERPFSGQPDLGRRLPAGPHVLGDDRGMDAATHVELGRQAHEARRGGAGQVVEDLVGDRLVEAAAVAEGPEVQLQRFQLDAQRIGHVFELQRGEVRLPGLRAQAGELRH